MLVPFLIVKTQRKLCEQPPLRQPTHAMVNAAIDMLMARIDDPDLAMEKRSYSGELVLGSSARLTES